MYFYADLIKINKFCAVYNFVIYFSKRELDVRHMPSADFNAKYSAQFNAGADKLQTLIQNFN